MPLTRSMTAPRAGRLVAAALVPIALGVAACGGGGGSGDARAATAPTSAPSTETTVTSATSADTTVTTAAASSGGQPTAGGATDWCPVLSLLEDKLADDGEGAALTYPQLADKMKGVQPPADAADSWNSVAAALTQPGTYPAIDPPAPQALGGAFARHCPGSL